MEKTTVALLGGSGSVGKPLFRHLLAQNWEKIVLLTRRELTEEEYQLDSPRVSQRVLPMGAEHSIEDLEAVAAAAFREEKVGVLLMTLGSGSSKILSKEELMRVDCGLPSAVGKAARAAGVNHAIVMTAVGADSKAGWSSLTKTAAGGSWYNHVKGTVEDNYSALEFDTLSIVRPATIIGAVATPKVVDWVARGLDPLVKRVADKYRCIRTEQLGAAQAGLAAAAVLGKLPPGKTVYEGAKIVSIG
jgi:nucleoside-diphosphate-sugar epimerase